MALVPNVPGAINVSSLDGTEIVPIATAGPQTAQTTTQDIANLGTNSPSAPTITGGTINGAIIGGSVPAAGTFTTLNATSTVQFNTANQTVAIAPSGTGTVTINPGTAGSIDNMPMGGFTPRTGAFTDLSASGVFKVASAVPASAAAAGVTGTVTWGSGFVYVCVATNTWQRAAIATW